MPLCYRLTWPPDTVAAYAITAHPIPYLDMTNPNLSDADKHLLLRFLTGELPSDEARRVRDRLEDEPNLATQLEQLQALQHALKASAARSFEPGFAQRVAQRITPRTTRESAAAPFDALYESLVGLFARVAIAAVFFIGALGVTNAIQYQEIGATTSTIEAVFGLPDVTLDQAMGEAVVYVEDE